ncbi:CsiV family protein [Marinicella rhabdoformis]|uniref:CsiV family protein n=1 Tax=Marinicella rhabdoformis TaxID=2580566 RepID=UPI0012AEC13E|nr:CsiV family protein [Marinicella rhabdoformis]
MKKMMYLLLAIQTGHAANYLPLSSGIQLYDVEVLVFARLLSQPESNQVSNRAEVDLTSLNAMEAADDDMAWLIESEKPDQEGDQWQVPIEGEKTSDAKALAWFSFNDLPSDNAVFNKIDKHPSMRALFYQKWRQPATPYRNPGFVKISNWSEDIPVDQPLDAPEEESIRNNTLAGFANENEPEDTFLVPIKPDYTIRGKVAFSKQRFQHGHVDINLYRESLDGETIIYRTEQSTQIELGSWQYFDHPQFGVMMKVTLVTDFSNKP